MGESLDIGNTKDGNGPGLNELGYCNIQVHYIHLLLLSNGPGIRWSCIQVLPLSTEITKKSPALRGGFLQ